MKSQYAFGILTSVFPAAALYAFLRDSFESHALKSTSPFAEEPTFNVSCKNVSVPPFHIHTLGVVVVVFHARKEISKKEEQGISPLFIFF